MPWMHPPFDLTPLHVPDEVEITYLALGWLHCESPSEVMDTPPSTTDDGDCANQSVDTLNDQQQQEDVRDGGAVNNVSAPRHTQRQGRQPKQQESRIDKWRSRGRH